MNDKNTQLQRQLESVVREANSEIGLLVNKKSELERDLELERKKVRELQDASREQTKEYQKLKAQYDKIKKKVLLGGPLGNDGIPTASSGGSHIQERASHSSRAQLDLSGAGVQRTPLITSNGAKGFNTDSQQRSNLNRFGFNHPNSMDRSTGISERSNSVNEVENYLLNPSHVRTSTSTRNFPSSNWPQPLGGQQQNQRGMSGITSSAIKRTSGFRPRQ